MSEIEFPQLYFDTYIFSQWLIESLHNSKLSIQDLIVKLGRFLKQLSKINLLASL
jgi:hypothetical protein